MKKRLCMLFMAVLLLGMTVMPAFAQQPGELVQITVNTYYDPLEKAFLYYVEDGTKAIHCSVADGMITEKAVTLAADAGIALEVYLNGNRLEGSFGGTFQQTGEYVVMYLGDSIAERVFSFTIVPPVCNYITGYTMPANFEILEATRDEEPVTFEKQYIKLADEGAYHIRYQCLKTNVSYELQLRTDFTGPELALAAVKDGRAQGPVDITDAKNASLVNIYHNGEKIARKDVLTESGEYHIELTDAAGNKTTYTFTILIYFDGNSWLFFVLILLSIIGTVAYLIHARKHLRVR